MTESQVLGLRAARQGLARPVRGEAGYRELFGRLQPVAPVFFSVPGSVPRLVHRTSFDDAETADRLRRRRELVKGRFGTGQIGYVLAADLEVYATAFRQVPARLGALERQVLEVLAATGPLSPRHLREEIGTLNKHLMPALHRLQRAFLVYEDQEDERWDRPWGLFASEWPDLELERQPWEVAAAAVVERFLEGYAFATEEQLRAWSGFPV
ncbi:MAG: crosslink repair DNA glycosylase YcaQ family protein, partial [Gemmatimonadota bacterium]